MSDSRFQQLEQKLQAQNKRIGDLETKYLQLLEDLKTLRTAVAGVIYPPPQPAQQNGKTPEYVSQFDRWPGAER